MADELQFIETSVNEIWNTVLDELENEVTEPLYPGDERRIFGEALTQVIVAVYSSVNDACRQKMLRYARGDVLDDLGETRSVERLDPTYATTTLRFGITTAVTYNIVIPAGVRASNDFEHYFATDNTAVLPAGSTYVDVPATATEGGSDYNGIAPAEICRIIDVSQVPLIETVENLTETAGGGDVEDDDSYRERIREAENKFSTAGPAKAYKYWALSANSLISDAVVVSDTEKLVRTLPVYGDHAYTGGDTLKLSTLKVYLSDGTTEAVSGTDYTASYANDTLSLALSGSLSGASSVKISIDRDMRGRVKIIPICAGGELPTSDVLADVLAVCSADDIKPLTDIVTVEAPSIENYDIELTYYVTSANESAVVAAVEGSGGAIDNYVYWQGSTLDQDINPDELLKRILLAGATRAEITKPVFTELDATTVAKFSGTKTVTHVVKN